MLVNNNKSGVQTKARRGIGWVVIAVVVVACVSAVVLPGSVPASIALITLWAGSAD